MMKTHQKSNIDGIGHKTSEARRQQQKQSADLPMLVSYLYQDPTLTPLTSLESIDSSDCEEGHNDANHSSSFLMKRASSKIKQKRSSHKVATTPAQANQGISSKQKLPSAAAKYLKKCDEKNQTQKLPSAVAKYMMKCEGKKVNDASAKTSKGGEDGAAEVIAGSKKQSNAVPKQTTTRLRLLCKQAKSQRDETVEPKPPPVPVAAAVEQPKEAMTVSGRKESRRQQKLKTFATRTQEGNETRRQQKVKEFALRTQEGNEKKVLYERKMKLRLENFLQKKQQRREEETTNHTENNMMVDEMHGHGEEADGGSSKTFLDFVEHLHVQQQQKNEQPRPQWQAEESFMDFVEHLLVEVDATNEYEYSPDSSLGRETLPSPEDVGKEWPDAPEAFIGGEVEELGVPDLPKPVLRVAMSDGEVEELGGPDLSKPVLKRYPTTPVDIAIYLTTEELTLPSSSKLEVSATDASSGILPIEQANEEMEEKVSVSSRRVSFLASRFRSSLDFFIKSCSKPDPDAGDDYSAAATSVYTPSEIDF